MQEREQNEIDMQLLPGNTRGGKVLLLMMMMTMVEELCYEGVASFVCECNF